MNSIAGIDLDAAPGKERKTMHCIYRRTGTIELLKPEEQSIGFIWIILQR